LKARSRSGSGGGAAFAGFKPGDFILSLAATPHGLAGAAVVRKN